MNPEVEFMTGAQVRAAARCGELDGPTPGMAPGFVQANLVIVPEEVAFDFLLFCLRNPKPCPLLEVVEAGGFVATSCGADSDLRKDLPRYCIYRSGEMAEEVSDLCRHWDDRLVSFLLGCSFTFETALTEARIPVRHIEQGCNVPMYRTSIPCRAAGRFSGNMVVSMRPMQSDQAYLASEICERYAMAHGAPIQIGSPEKIGIQNLSTPDFGDAVEIRSGELPVFWACGVTPQSVAIDSKLSLVITHKPGHMLVTDIRDIDLLDAHSMADTGPS